MTTNYVNDINPLLASSLETTNERRRLVAGFDLAFSRDGCALVVLEHEADRVTVIDHDFRLPQPSAPLDPIATCDEYLDRISALGCRNVAADVHYVEVLRRAATARSIALHQAPSGAERTHSFSTLRHYTRARSISLPRQVSAHMARIQSVARVGGELSIQAPRSTGEGHSDLAFALVAAAWLDMRLHGVVGANVASVVTHRGGWSAP